MSRSLCQSFPTIRCLLGCNQAVSGCQSATFSSGSVTHFFLPDLEPWHVQIWEDTICLTADLRHGLKNVTWRETESHFSAFPNICAFGFCNCGSCVSWSRPTPTCHPRCSWLAPHCDSNVDSIDYASKRHIKALVACSRCGVAVVRERRCTFEGKPCLMTPFILSRLWPSVMVPYPGGGKGSDKPLAHLACQRPPMKYKSSLCIHCTVRICPPNSNNKRYKCAIVNLPGFNVSNLGLTWGSMSIQVHADI